MSEEFSTLQRQGTRSIVPYTPDKHLVGCQWVYILKHKHGSIAQFKARLVATGFHQDQGLDYNQTFSPVVKQATIRVVLSLAVQFNWPLHQLDVTNAFLHGILPNHACRLHKSLYRLKQVPRAWFERFPNDLLGLGFHSTYADSSLFVKHYMNSVTVILLYVDDLVMTGNDSGYITYLISQLSLIFEMKNLSKLHHFLGI